MKVADDELITASSKQYGDFERQMQDIFLDHKRSHQVPEMDGKQSDEVFIQLQLDTGFASPVSRLSVC